MKRILTILSLTVISIAASAQYNPSAELLKKGGKLYQGETRLSTEQVENILSEIYDENGVEYSRLWDKANGMRTAGIVLTTVGSVATVAGPTVTLIGAIIGLAEGLGTGLGAGLASALGGTPNPDNPEASKANGVIIAGVAVTGAGVAMLGSGIPLLCVGNRRMKNIVSDYNGRLNSDAYPEVTLAFGQCSGGIGLSICF